jgi:hypothetical protein
MWCGSCKTLHSITDKIKDGHLRTSAELFWTPEELDPSNDSFHTQMTVAAAFFFEDANAAYVCRKGVPSISVRRETAGQEKLADGPSG